MIQFDENQLQEIGLNAKSVVVGDNLIIVQPHKNRRLIIYRQDE